MRIMKLWVLFQLSLVVFFKVCTGSTHYTLWRLWVLIDSLLKIHMEERGNLRKDLVPPGSMQNHAVFCVFFRSVLFMSYVN